MTRWMYGAFAVIALTVVGSAIVGTQYLDRFPERMPTHYDIHGVADKYADRAHTYTSFYLLPTFAGALVAMCCVLPWLSPENFKIDGFRVTYDYAVFLMALLFAWLHGVFLASAAHGELLGRWLSVGMFVFFALLGNVLGRVRRNFWIGVRTPWTLASEVVWERTHRLAAWVFVALGIVGGVASLAGVSQIVCYSGLPVAALVPVVYSLVLYKRLEKSGGL